MNGGVTPSELGRRNTEDEGVSLSLPDSERDTKPALMPSLPFSRGWAGV